MKIERLEDLLEWTRRTHQHLGQCMAHCADQQHDTLGAWLLAYLARHEAALARTVGNIERHAEQEALRTWIRDALAENPLHIEAACAPFGDMALEEIARELDATHQHILALYRHLAQHAANDEARLLLTDLLLLEEHETARLVAQARRLDEL